MARPENAIQKRQKSCGHRVPVGRPDAGTRGRSSRRWVPLPGGRLGLNNPAITQRRFQSYSGIKTANHRDDC